MSAADPPENREPGKPSDHTTGHPRPSEVAIPPATIESSSLTTLVVTTSSSAVAGNVTVVTTTVSRTSSAATTTVASTTPITSRLHQGTTTKPSPLNKNRTALRGIIPTTTSSRTAFTSTTTTTTLSITTTTVSSLSHLHHPFTSAKLSRPPIRQLNQEKSSIAPMGAVAPVPCDTPGGLLHPTVEVNGHALPQGAGESRDAPRNPSALPAYPSVPTALHGERLISPVTACVAPPTLRLADAQRERERLASGNQRMMSRPIKRKLWPVDHERLEAELKEEYSQIVEEDEKRFKERWEVVGLIKNPPACYTSEVKTRNKKHKAAPSSSTLSSSSHSPPPPKSPSSSNGRNSACANSATRAASPSVTKSSEKEGQESVKSPEADDTKTSEGSPGDLKSSSKATPSADASPGRPSPSEGVPESNLLSEKQNLMESTPDTPSSTLTSPASLSSSSSSSSLNLSTSLRSSSGVSSLESTPSEETMTTVTPAGSDTPTQRDTPTAGRIAPTQETTALTQRPTTRSSRMRRSAQRSSSGPPRKNLRM